VSAGQRWGGLHAQQAEGIGREGTAGMEHADLPDFHTAIGPDRREEPAETRHDVEVGSAWACPAHLTGGKSDRAVLATDNPWGGEGNPADRGSEGGAGGVAVVLRLPVDVPGEGPDLGGEGLQESGWAPLGFAERTGDG